MGEGGGGRGGERGGVNREKFIHREDTIINVSTSARGTQYMSL